MPKLAYHRILLKLSGEALGRPAQGIEQSRLQLCVNELRALRRLGVELAVVIGAGNLWRKRNQGAGMDPKTADYIGMVATVMNALALAQALERVGVRASVQSALAADVRGVEPLNYKKARKELAHGVVVLFAGGTGKPFFTTDTAAAERAREVKAQLIIKAGPVDGVYSADPVKYPRAKKYAHLTMSEALRKKLQVMDTAAFKKCKQARMPIVVCQWRKGVVGQVVQGRRVGTLVTP